VPTSLARKLIDAHLVDAAGSEPAPGSEIALRIDQTLTQDATGTMVMLELEAMGVERVRTRLSAQYVDHNLVQEDYKNADDHRFLRSACQRFGLWYSRPGNGVSHPVHQERFGAPGLTLLGSDSHTCAAGAIGMLAIGAGGLEVALAMAGEPFHLKMPQIWNVRLTGELPDWVSAKDVILEMLRRHGVSGGVGRIVEYTGPGLAGLSAMDRHVIANMGAELGATATVFPADEEVRRFLESQGRAADYEAWGPDEGAPYDVEDEIDLSALEPLIALPSSPGNVKRVREVAGEPIGQAYVGSSANPGFRDFAVCAGMVKGRVTDPGVSFDVNPTSRQILTNLIEQGHLGPLLAAGARLHQAGCNGCIGMGQAPATDTKSLRTVPRNFPGRSGTQEDQVCLVSPETATASALTGVITDPRDWAAEAGVSCPRIREPEKPTLVTQTLVPPLPAEQARRVELEKGPNIATLPHFEPLPERLDLPILLVAGDDVSTDEIMPAGARVLPFRSNVPEISRFCFEALDASYPERAEDVRDEGGHAIAGGRNYGQGSSREHAALAPRYLGLRLVLAKSFARIHWQNLVNFGVLPLTFADADAAPVLEAGQRLVLEDAREALQRGPELRLREPDGGREIAVRHDLSSRQVAIVLEGGLINRMRERIGQQG